MKLDITVHFVNISRRAFQMKTSAGFNTLGNWIMSKMVNNTCTGIVNDGIIDSAMKSYSTHIDEMHCKHIEIVKTTNCFNIANVYLIFYFMNLIC